MWIGGGVDIAFCALPHGTTQEVIAKLWRHERLKIIDLSADFRLQDLALYERWYGKAHAAPELQGYACYGLSEWHGRGIASSRLVANPGCYATACQLALLACCGQGCVGDGFYKRSFRGERRGTEFA